ncbi:MAG: 50S ribosomal protein L10 [Patescibacteria group bacterium]
MPITRTKKESIVAELQSKIGKSKAMLFGRFHGLSVAKITELRRTFRREDAEYMVAKKTLLRVAFRESGKDLSLDLPGEIGIAAGFGDELSIFRAASAFAKKEKGAFEIVGGFFEGQFVDAKTAKALGAIPGREVLYAQLMSVILGNTRKLVYVLDQLSKKKS